MKLLREKVAKSKDGKWLNEYQCACGKPHVARPYVIAKGITKTCGCKLGAASRTHGQSHTPEYKADWYARNRHRLSEKAKEYYQKTKSEYFARGLERLYGLSVNQYFGILAQQESRCKICKKQFGEDRPNWANIDHCHKTGRVRGLLCYNCNTLLGQAKDDPTILSAAIIYLKESA